jgi:hypothetical protein
MLSKGLFLEQGVEPVGPGVEVALAAAAAQRRLQLGLGELGRL